MITTAALAQIMAEQKCLHLLVLSLIIVAVDRRRKSQEIPSQDWNFNEALAGSFCAGGGATAQFSSPPPIAQ